jgi:hypothetical protein
MTYKPKLNETHEIHLPKWLSDIIDHCKKHAKYYAAVFTAMFVSMQMSSVKEALHIKWGGHEHDFLQIPQLFITAFFVIFAGLAAGETSKKKTNE